MPIFQRGQIEKEERFRKTIIDAVYEKKIDRSEIDELIKSKYKEVFNTSEKNAREYVQSLYSSFDAKKEQHAALSEKSQELEDAYYAKWKPFVDLILLQFDEIMAEFRKRGEGVNNDVRDGINLIIDIEKESVSTKIIRKATFQNGNYIEIVCEPAQIEKGIFIKRGRLIFNAKKKYSKGFAFEFFLEDKLIWLYSNDPRYARYNNQQIRTDINPIDDRNFCDNSIEILNKFIANIFYSDR
jgi:hypothetical protein